MATSSLQRPRIYSLDALRGLDMLLILGIDSLANALAHIHTGEAWQAFARQMRHEAWEGLSVYDCVFPLFVFLSGVSLFISTRNSQLKGRSAWERLYKMWKRAAVLIVLGWLVNGRVTLAPDTMRFASVLGLIGVSGAAAGTIMLLLRRTHAAWIAAIVLLAGVWSAQHMGGDYTPTGCVNAVIDARYCPGILHNGSYDPEGILCLLSATALSLLGYIAGSALCGESRCYRWVFLALGGCVMFSLGHSGAVGPCIKNIWTPAFVLSAAGLGALLLLLFHLAADNAPGGAATFPLRVIGCNALFAYVISRIVDFNELSQRALCGLWECLLPEKWHPIASCCGAIFLVWFLCLALYRRKLFLRI